MFSSSSSVANIFLRGDAFGQTSGREGAHVSQGAMGLIYGMDRALLRYLTSFITKARVIAASHTGWLDNTFVLPGESINEPTNEKIVYQPQGLSNLTKVPRQLDLFTNKKTDKQERLDQAIDKIRDEFGKESIIWGRLLKS